MSDRDGNEYEAGFRKPPRHGQFKPGHSGNPKGRPKGAKNLATLLGRTLSERVLVTENGRRRSISKLEAAVKVLVNKAASGDAKFMHQLLALVHLVEGRPEALAAPPIPFTDADREVLRGIAERLGSHYQEKKDA
jgi:hypothetical protein